LPSVEANVRGVEVPRRTISARVGRQFVRFCVVGASGYVVNLAVYASLLEAGLGYLAAATLSFLIAASSNFVWNRLWTFGARQQRVASQSLRALGVSALSLGANQLCLIVLVETGADHLAAQAVAILFVKPFSFVANKLWAFRKPQRYLQLRTEAIGP
jgi:putative flippase GtrA